MSDVSSSKRKLLPGEQPNGDWILDGKEWSTSDTPVKPKKHRILDEWETPFRRFNPNHDELGRFAEGDGGGGGADKSSSTVDEIMNLLDSPAPPAPEGYVEEKTPEEIASEKESARVRAELDKIPLPDSDVVTAFKKLADEQRGAPERAMLDVQFANGGGVLNGVVEHVGDITNRMAKDTQYYDDGHELVLDKAEKTLGWLMNRYGFAREHEENLRSNAKVRGLTYEDNKAKVDAALKKYGEAHAKLTVYNEPQWHARQAAVELGKQRWPYAAEHLDWLVKLAKDPVKYRKEVWSFERNDKGHLLEYDQDARGNRVKQ